MSHYIDTTVNDHEAGVTFKYTERKGINWPKVEIISVVVAGKNMIVSIDDGDRIARECFKAMEFLTNEGVMV